MAEHWQALTLLSFLAKQLASGVVTVFLVITLTFGLMRALPGGPFDQDRQFPPEVKRNLEARFHLNEPLPVQYALYLGGLLRGDFGPSFKYQSRQVSDIIAESAGVSFALGALALVLGSVLGFAMGAMAGFTRLPWLDGLLSAIGMVGMSTPLFVFGGCLVLVFALGLQWLPVATLQTPKHWVLPVIALSLTPFAYGFMLVRSAVREAQTLPHVRMKRSYGLSEWQIGLRHVLRNAWLPFISMLGPIAATLLTGSFAIETIFAIPGLGKHFISAVSNRDYTLVMGITILYSVVLVVLNMLTDLCYGWLDPRIRVETSE